MSRGSWAGTAGGSSLVDLLGSDVGADTAVADAVAAAVADADTAVAGTDTAAVVVADDGVACGAAVVVVVACSTDPAVGRIAVVGTNSSSCHLLETV